MAGRWCGEAVMSTRVDVSRVAAGGAALRFISVVRIGTIVPSLLPANERRVRISLELSAMAEAAGKRPGQTALPALSEISNNRPKQCRSHHSGTCTREQNACSDAANSVCNNREGECFCYATTGRARFCGRPGFGQCMGCRRDRDCEAVTGPGSACVAMEEHGGLCGCAGTPPFHITACIPPCPA